METIKGIIDSLSFESGAVVVAILSMIVMVGMSRFGVKKIKWSLALTLPFIIANVFYWVPVFLGASLSEYGTWAPIFIIPWYVAGFLASSLIVAVVNRRKRKGNERSG